MSSSITIAGTTDKIKHITPTEVQIVLVVSKLLFLSLT